jgi:hypothetical protein
LFARNELALTVIAFIENDSEPHHEIPFSRQPKALGVFGVDAGRWAIGGRDTREAGRSGAILPSRSLKLWVRRNFAGGNPSSYKYDKAAAMTDRTRGMPPPRIH